MVVRSRHERLVSPGDHPLCPVPCRGRTP